MALCQEPNLTHMNRMKNQKHSIITIKKHSRGNLALRAKAAPKCTDINNARITIQAQYQRKK